jgi:hypothetical protein
MDTGADVSSSSQLMRSSPIPSSCDPCKAFAKAKDAERSVQTVLPGRVPSPDRGVRGNDDVEMCRGM